MSLPFVPYNPGTIAVTNGSKNLVGTSTNFTAYALYDWILINSGILAMFETITDDTHATMVLAYAGTTGSAKTYTWIPQPELTRVTAALTSISALLANSNVSSLATLTLAANKGLMATGAGALSQFDLPASTRTGLAAGFSADVLDLLDSANDAAILTALGISVTPASTTFTPTVLGTTVAGAGTYATQNGWITSIGNARIFGLQVSITAHTGTGNMKIGGLPTAAAASTPYAANLRVQSLTYSDRLQARIVGTEIILETVASGGAAAALAMDTSCNIMASGVYHT